MSSIVANQIEEVIPSAWSVRPFEDLVFFQEGPGIRNWQYVPKGVPFVNIRCLVDGRLYVQAMSHVSEEEALGKYKHFLLDADDFVVSSSGTLGRIATVNTSDLPCMLNTSIIRMRPKGPALDRRFLKYFLLSEYYQLQIFSFATGSAQLNYGPRHLRQMFIFSPPITDQRAIAHILGTLDDKIELNRRQNETLEAMAQAMFKAWFVDFEPVRAKMKGRWKRGQSLPGLPAHLYELFPDRLIESELGEIPEGWKITTIDVDFDITMGQSPPGKTYNETGDGLPFYQGCTDFGFRFPKRRIYCTAPSRLAKKGDTLVSVRAPVGQINMSSEDCAIGRGVASIRHKTGSVSYSYYLMKSISDALEKFNTEGTVFGSMGKKDFCSIPHKQPTSELILAFENLTSKCDEQIAKNDFESRYFIQLRDTLLPKLISGDLRIPNGTLTDSK